jgi:hypothetical protein
VQLFRGMQTDRRLRSNARHERTLAPVASTDHSRRRRITTNRKPHRSTTTPAPTRHPARSAQIRPCSPSQPINLHSLATFRPHWTTPRFPPSRLIRRLPIRPAAHSHSCGRRQASNNPKRMRTWGNKIKRSRPPPNLRFGNRPITASRPSPFVSSLCQPFQQLAWTICKVSNRSRRR